MKKFFIILLVLASINLEAQSLLKFGITYTIGKEQSLLGKKKNLTHETNINSSFGAGLTLDLGYIYLNNNTFGPEATFSFFIGKPKTIEHVVDNKTDQLIVINRKILFFSPALFLIGNSTKEVNPYLSSGLLFNVWENVIKTESITNINSDKIVKTSKVNYNKGIGYKSKIGMLYNSTNHLSYFAEMQYQMFSIGYKNEIVKASTVNQVDALSTLSNSEKQTNFNIELTNESNHPFSTTFDTNKPTDLGLKYANHNHFGLSGGVFVHFK